MFGEEAYGFGSGVEKEARDLPNKPGQQRAKLRRYFFEAVCHSFSGCFQTFGEGAHNCTNSDARGNKDGCHGNAIFFNISLTLSRRGMASSLSTIWVCSLASSSFLAATRSSAASLSNDKAFSSLIIA